MNAMTMTLPPITIPQRVNTYVRRDRLRVGGWFTALDGRIFGQLLAAQTALGVTGSVAEIGVHHGKSFLALVLGKAADEHAICVDVFENQSANSDGSGQGDEAILRRNIETYAPDADHVTILKRSSLELSPGDLTAIGGPVRFFSVDGGHWLDIVKNDLRLAEAVLAHGGIVALDDYSHPDWPEVSLGFGEWFRTSGRDVVPFAITGAKLYLARADFAATYREVLGLDLAIRQDFKKTTDILGSPADVYTRYPWVIERAKQLFINRYPDAFQRLKALKRSLRKGG